MTKTVYFDASVLVSLFVTDAGTPRARAMAASGFSIVISDFAAAEVASALNLMVRSRRLTLADARAVLDAFDLWAQEHAASADLESADIARADGYLRRLSLPLRTPDALHVAVADRLGLPLATLDLRMREAAAALGVALEPVIQA